MKILFTPSDNNATSGAFLSMVKLCSILQNEYGCEILVILRCKGSGEDLLVQNNLDYKFITSFDWFIPYRPKTTVRKLKRFLCNFWMPMAIMYNKIAIERIKKLINLEGIDIVHNNTSCAYVGAAAALKAGIPFVWHIREFLEEDQERCIWHKNKAYSLMAKSDRVITISESIYQKYAKCLKNAKLIKTHNGIDESEFLDNGHVIFSEKKLQFLMVGSINESKGQYQAIMASKGLVDRGINNFELRIAGKNSSYSQKLKAQSEALGLSDYVKFIGPQKDVAKLYHSSDIAFMCSSSEAFGRVTVEAMLSGCLVIGTDAGGTVELIENMSTGMLYESGNIEGLVGKILYAIDHKQESREIASRGRTKMAATMTAGNNANQIYSVYKGILGEDV